MSPSRRGGAAAPPYHKNSKPRSNSGLFHFVFGRAEVPLRLFFLPIRTMLPMRNIGAARQHRPTLEDEGAKKAKKK
jgi:hypothetical protein